MDQQVVYSAKQIILTMDTLRNMVCMYQTRNVCLPPLFTNGDKAIVDSAVTVMHGYRGLLDQMPKPIQDTARALVINSRIYYHIGTLEQYLLLEKSKCENGK